VFADLHPSVRGADAIDAVLHGQRLVALADRAPVAVATLPDGAFVQHDGAAWLVLGGSLRRWSPEGYGERATVARAVPITPPSLLAVLARGWQPEVPLLHQSALRSQAPVR
jgi:hypothetical protein